LLWGSHRLLFDKVFAYDNPFPFTGLVLRYCEKSLNWAIRVE